MSITIKPTLGRIVWYRGEDGEFRAAIVVGLNSDFNVNLHVFGHYAGDTQCGAIDSVTHADPEQEPLCFPSWHWMPYQIEQAKKQASAVLAAKNDPIEQQIQAKGLTAPRVKPSDIEANIASEHYFTAAQGILGSVAADVEAKKKVPYGPEQLVEILDGPTSLLTFCVLVLQNGFTVTGESACASPENFNAEIGREIARQNAVQKIWPLMGYALKQQLCIAQAIESGKQAAADAFGQ